MEMKDYNLTCGEVIDNLLTLADAYEKASAGKAPNGFAFNPTDAAASMKAAVHFIGSFGQQLPRWIPVTERLPDNYELVMVGWAGRRDIGKGYVLFGKWHDPYFSQPDANQPTHWMPLPEPPPASK